jgi:hypothetical protein
MSNKKQTAVDFAFETLASQGLLVYDDYKNLDAYTKAKAIEKEQIIDSYTECWEKDGGNGYHKVNEAEQYYTETYGD